jgi:hypothetical protein
MGLDTEGFIFRGTYIRNGLTVSEYGGLIHRTELKDFSSHIYFYIGRALCDYYNKRVGKGI